MQRIGTVLRTLFLLTCFLAITLSGLPARGQLWGTDLALNATMTGYPSPLESDHGWGGGAHPWEIVDGLREYNHWAHGLAFTGGHTGGWNSGGWIEPAGPRQATIDFGQLETFNKVVIWHHGVAYTPAEATLQYWNGTQWNGINADRHYGNYHVDGQNSGYSASDEYDFSLVTGSKVRYAFDNSGANVLGGPNVHGWIYEFEVYHIASSVSEPGTVALFSSTLVGGMGLFLLRHRK